MPWKKVKFTIWCASFLFKTVLSRQTAALDICSNTNNVCLPFPSKQRHPFVVLWIMTDVRPATGEHQYLVILQSPALNSMTISLKQHDVEIGVCVGALVTRHSTIRIFSVILRGKKKKVKKKKSHYIVFTTSAKILTSYKICVWQLLYS